MSMSTDNSPQSPSPIAPVANDVWANLSNIVITDLPQVVQFADMLAPYVIPAGATVLGLTVPQVGAIALGIAYGIPEIEALYNAIKAATTPGAPAPTDAQWAAWNAAADQAHTAFQAELQKRLAQAAQVEAVKGS